MSRIFKYLLVSLLLCAVTTSCEKDDFLEETVAPETELNDSILDEIINGTKLENPYSVKNMTQAWKNISGSITTKSVFGDPLPTTHLYIRYEPDSELALSQLLSDTSLILYSYPLDYELKDLEQVYRGVSANSPELLYRYAAIPVDKEVTKGIKFTILEKLFIPEEQEGLGNTQNFFESESDIDALVDEALFITKNIKAKDGDSRILKRRRRWTPAGRIRVFDDTNVFGSTQVGYIGVEGVEVRARRWFTTHVGIADANGRFRCGGTFKRSANYSIQWDRKDFSIRSISFGQAIENGPKQEGDWNRDFEDNTVQQMYAVNYMGAHTYYYGGIQGLKRPPLNSFTSPQVKIGTSFKSGRAGHGAYDRLLGIFDRIDVYFKENDRVSSFQRKYGTINS